MPKTGVVCRDVSEKSSGEAPRSVRWDCGRERSEGQVGRAEGRLSGIRRRIAGIKFKF